MTEPTSRNTFADFSELNSCLVKSANTISSLHWSKIILINYYHIEWHSSLYYGFYWCTYYKLFAKYRRELCEVFLLNLFKIVRDICGSYADPDPHGYRRAKIVANLQKAEDFKLNTVFVLLIPVLLEITKTKNKNLYFPYQLCIILCFFYFLGRLLLLGSGSAWRLMRIQDPQHWLEVDFLRWIP